MLKNKKLATIFMIVLVFIIGVIAYGWLSNENNKKVFASDGYILGEVQLNDEKKNELGNGYYFSKGDHFNYKYPSKISFEDKNGDKIVTDENNFVHYADKSLMALSDGVFINLDKLEDKPLRYYNVADNVEFTKKGNAYIAGAQNDEPLQNFIWKISDEKYLITSDTLNLHFSQGNEKKVEDYIELSFIDKGVVLLANNEISYQTIAKDAYIELANGIRIGLQNKEIKKDETSFLTLSQMVIDSDDNIEVIEKEETENKEDKEETKEPIENKDPQNSRDDGTTGTGSGSGGTSGTGNPSDTNGDKGEDNTPGENPDDDNNDSDNTEEDTDAMFPTLEFTEFSVGLNRVEAKASFQDEDGLLKGIIRESIYETETNRLVYYNEYENEGLLSLEIRNEKLKPDTNYVIIVNADYEYKDKTYKKDFGNKAFKTDNLGLAFSKNYVTSGAISVQIQAQEYSEVSEANMVLREKGKSEILQTKKIFIGEIVQIGNYIVDFDNLQSNKEYVVSIEEMRIGSVDLASNDISLEKSIKTLKKVPEFGEAGVRVLDKTSQFQFYTMAMNGTSNATFNDPDNGIATYRYEVFLASDITLDEMAKPVKTIEVKSPSDVYVQVEKSESNNGESSKDSLVSGVNYVYRLTVEFNDNEKMIEYSNNYSQPFSMGKDQAALVIWQPNENDPSQGGIGHDRINGVLTLDDYSDTINRNKGLLITVQGANEESRTIKVDSDGNSNNYPVDIQGLKADELYYFRVYAILKENNEDIEQYSYIGGFTQRTIKTSKVKVHTRELTSNLKEAFQIDFMLSDNDEPEDKDMLYTISTLRPIKINLFEGSAEDVRSGKVKTAIATQMLTIDGNEEYYQNGEDITKYSYNYAQSSAIEDYYVKKGEIIGGNEKNKFEITPKTFNNFDSSQVTKEVYTIEVEYGKDYTANKNAVVFYNDGNQEEKRCLIEVTPHGFMPDLPRQDTWNDALLVNSIVNTKTSIDSLAGSASNWSVDERLKSSTTIGYRVQERTFPTAAIKYAESITYSAIDSETGVVIKSQTIDVDDKTAVNLPSALFKVEDGIDKKENQEAGKLYRGNKYHFTYTVKLNLSLNPSEPVYKTYPTDCIDQDGNNIGQGVTLRSLNQSCVKETPRVYSNLKESLKEQGLSTQTQKWSLYYLDFDHAILSESIFVNDVKKEHMFTLNNKINHATELYQSDLELSGLVIGNSMISKDVHLLFSEETKMNMFSNPIELNKIETTDLEYTFDTSQVGKLIININDKSGKNQLSKIAGIDVTLTNNAVSKTAKNLPIVVNEDNGSQATVTAPLTAFSQLVGKECTPEIKVHYDSGLVGTNTLNNTGYILKYYDRKANTGYQYVNGFDSGLIVSKNASGSLYKGAFKDNIKEVLEKTSALIKPKSSFTAEQQLYEVTNSHTYDFAFDIQGMNYNANNTPAPDNSKYYVPAKVESTRIQPAQGSDTVTFDFIPPEVFGVSAIGRLIDAEVSLQIDTKNISKIKDNKAYLQVYTTDNPAQPIGQALPIDLTLNTKNEYKVILDKTTLGEDLVLGKSYKFELYTTVVSADGQREERRNLIDNEENEIKIPGTEFYRLQQVGVVNLSQLRYEFVNTSYEDKKIKFTFDTDTLNGYDVEFYLLDQDVVGASEVKIGTKDTGFLYSDSTFEVAVEQEGTNPADQSKVQVILGHRYVVRMQAVTKGSTKEVVGDARLDITMTPLQSSFVAINPSIKGTKLNVALTISDSSFAVERDTYEAILLVGGVQQKRVEIHAGEDGIEHIESIFNDIDISGKYNLTYEIQVSRKDNIYYNQNLEENVTTKTIKTPNDQGISLGTSVDALIEDKVKEAGFDNGKEHTRIRIDLEEPIGIDKVTMATFTITSPDGKTKTITDNNLRFTLKEDASSGYRYYAYYLKTDDVGYADTLAAGNYQISAIFMDNNRNIVGQEAMKFKVSAKNKLAALFSDLFGQ